MSPIYVIYALIYGYIIMVIYEFDLIQVQNYFKGRQTGESKMKIIENCMQSKPQR